MNYWKNKAKTSIRGKIGIFFVISLITSFQAFLNVDYSNILSIINEQLIVNETGYYIPKEIINAFLILGIISVVITFLLNAVFSLSNHYVYIKLVYEEKVKISDSFYGFKDFGSAVKLYFLMGLYISLWSMLFYIPGIIKSYEYSMAPYILANNPGMSPNECLRKSKEMTNGYKFSLFLLDLSFIGWNLLSVLTLGILSIWVNPYYQASKAYAYLEMNSDNLDDENDIDDDDDEDNIDDDESFNEETNDVQ